MFTKKTMILVVLAMLAMVLVKSQLNATLPEKEPMRYIITGVPAYEQEKITIKGEKRYYGCGPCAALMLMAYYDRRFGFKDLIPASCESEAVPLDLIHELRDRMKATPVAGDLTLTVPEFFKSGLKKYIKQFYDVDIKSKSTLGFGSLDKVFEQSVELIKSNKPHIICFDWKPKGTLGSNLFANHYSVVVGYNKKDKKKHLIINLGHGDSWNYQVIDLSDKKIKPVRIYWLEMKSSANGPRDAHPIGPAVQSKWTDFVKQSDGRFKMVPTLGKYSDPSTNKDKRVSFEPCDRLVFPISEENKAKNNPLPTISFCKWYD